VLSGVLGLIAGVHDLRGVDVFDRAYAGTLTLEQANSWDSLFGTLGSLQLVAIIAVFVAFLAWQSRSVDNVPGLGGGTPIVTPGWSIAWWFIPIANFFQPYRIVADLYRRMGSAGVGVGIVLAWWLLWLATSAVSLAAGGVYSAAQDLSSAQSGLMLWAISDFGDLAVALVSILIILRIQGWADVRMAGLSNPSNLEPEPVPAADGLAG
jgi:Domain of unknown function (DUF4328)